MKRISISRNKKRAATLALLALTGMTFFTTHAIHTYAKGNASREKLYTSVRIEEGDSLWTMAGDRISSEYASVNDYICEVKHINHIDGDLIHEGAYLILPYYAHAK